MFLMTVFSVLFSLKRNMMFHNPLTVPLFSRITYYVNKQGMGQIWLICTNCRRGICLGQQGTEQSCATVLVIRFPSQMSCQVFTFTRSHATAQLKYSCCLPPVPLTLYFQI